MHAWLSGMTVRLGRLAQNYNVKVINSKWHLVSMRGRSLAIGVEECCRTVPESGRKKQMYEDGILWLVVTATVAQATCKPLQPKHLQKFLLLIVP